MSTSPDEQGARRDCSDAPATGMKAAAEQLVALIEEFAAVLSEGHAPPAFAERLAQLRQTAERLI